MLKITRNKWFSRVKIKRICCRIWKVMFVFSTIDYAVSQTDSFQMTYVTAEGVRMSLLIPLVTFPSAVLQLFCFARIFLVTRKKIRRTPPRADGSPRANQGRFFSIAVFQIIAFIICDLPSSVYLLLLYANAVNLSKSLVIGLAMLTFLSSLLNPIFFFRNLQTQMDKKTTECESYV